MKADDFLDDLPAPAASSAFNADDFLSDRAADGSVPLPAGVKPSTAAGGRSSGIGGPTAAQMTPRQADSPYRDKREAIDDAVDQIELGAPSDKVFAQFEKLGVSRQEIIARGTKLGGKAFTPDTRPVTVRSGARDGQMSKYETGILEDTSNFGKRVAGRMSQAATGIAAQTGLVGPELAAQMLAKDQKRIEAAAPGEEVQQQLERIGKVKEWGEVPGALVENPKATLMMLGESVAMTAPLIGAAALRMGAAGMAAVAGTTSGGIEYGSSLAEALGDRNVSLLDVEKVQALLKDEKFLADARERAAKRGLAVGAFDALTAGFAGKFIEPALEAVRAGKLTGKAANRAVASAWSKELGMQAAGGMAGEQLGQTLTGENKPFEVALEGLGETVSAPIEALSNVRDAREAKFNASPEAQFARAFEQDTADTYFKQEGIDGFARAALTPGTVLTDPNAVRPEDTRVPQAPPPVKAEDMPADRVVTPEELTAEMARADATKAAQAMAAGEVPPVGAAGLKQGSLAQRAAAVATQAGDEGGRLQGGPDAGAGDVGAQGAPDAQGGVADAGRAAGEPQGAMAGGAAPARAQGPARGNATAGTSVASMRSRYARMRYEQMMRAQTMESRAAELRAVGMRQDADKLIESARQIRLSAVRLPQMSEPQQGPGLQQFNTLADALQRVTGRRPQAYSDVGSNAADGFFDNEVGQVFVNIDAPEMPVVSTVFHEFKHQVRALARSGNANAKRAEEMLDKVWDMISPEGKRTYAEKYLFKAELRSPGTTVEQLLQDPKKLDILREEMLADFMGKRALDKKFMRKLARREPKVFGDFVKQWLKVLTDLIDELRGTGGAKEKDVDAFISKLEEARAIAEDVMIEWAKANPESAKAAGVEPSYSVRGANRDPAAPPLPPLDFYEDEIPPDVPARAFTVDRRTGSKGGSNDELGAFNLDRMDDGDKADSTDGADAVDDAVRFIADKLGQSEEYVRKTWDFQDPKKYIELADDMKRKAANVDAAGYPDVPLPSIEESMIDMQNLANEVAADTGIGVRISPERERRSDPIIPVSYEAVTDDQIKSAGIMAERAYPEPNWRTSADDLIGDITMEGGRSFEVRVRPEGARGSDPFSYPRGVVERSAAGQGDGPAVANFDGPVGDNWTRLSVDKSKQLATTFAASADLYARKFDLFTAIPRAARKRVIDTWKQIAKIRGAFEFGLVPKDVQGTIVSVGQQVADAVTKGTRYSVVVKASNSRVTGIVITDKKTGETGTGLIEQKNASILPGDVRKFGTPETHFVLHSDGFNRGTSFGKPFYQVALAIVNAVGDIPVEADFALLGVNNFRRTEQMMSAAARSGNSTLVRPGIGQRIYGWNRRARGEEQSDRNFARTALAAARNAAEFVPEVRNLRYDVANDKFSWADGADAEDFVKGALGNPDVRLVSISRSTLARAAVTFSAMDNAIDLTGVTEIKSPVLYSARSGDEYAAWVDPMADGYSRLAGRKVSYEVRVANTGDIATLTADAQNAMRSLDERANTMRNLISCLQR